MNVYTVKYDHTIPVDDDEFPDDFEISAMSREIAFEEIREEIMCDPFPLEDVLENGESVFDEFEEYIENNMNQQ